MDNEVRVSRALFGPMEFVDAIILRLTLACERFLNTAYQKLRPSMSDTRTSLVIIVSSLVFITILLFSSGLSETTKDIQESGYFLYGIPIIYSILAFSDTSSGLKVAAGSYPLWFLGIISRLLRKIAEGDYSDLVVESAIVPFLYFIACLVVGRLVLREKNLLEKHKTVATQLAVQNKLLERYHSDMVKTLTQAIDAKDTYTRGHSERVGCYSLAVAKAIGLSNEEQRDIFYAGALHDIGKIGISDNILLKPSSLSNDEYREIKTHSEIGYRIIGEFESMGNVKSLIFNHHERCDGSGYPKGVSGENIPLGAKIIAVVDSYDALVSKRTYQNEVKQEEAVNELTRCSGKLFDSQVVTVFLDLLQKGRLDLEFKTCMQYVSKLT